MNEIQFVKSLNEQEKKIILALLASEYLESVGVKKSNELTVEDFLNKYSSQIPIRLYRILRHEYPQDILIKDININQFRKLRNVGKKTVNDFIKLINQ